MQNEIEQIAQQNKMSIEFVTWFFNEKKSACGEHWFLMLGAMWEGWKGRSIEMDKLAAENVGLKEAIPQLKNIDYQNESIDDVTLAEEIGFNAAVMAMHRWVPKTPATDRIVAGIKADAITASLDACSDYLETDCVMDRLDISYEEAEKRTSGAIEFHDAMVDFANQVREGADK
ncbi:hypothetical protein [Klebsiella quasipneumoniae]|uniref:hypothetical protein n=1 Tax=Klebsiella quasipneumoniae TaxID=1463165 RepID=UPI002DB97631|nr:hypothetical protein [Klebsiella quasipneumoniae]MEB5816661.1 hypothetical protein [Klebsiella quasipneumoniae]